MIVRTSQRCFSSFRKDGGNEYGFGLGIRLWLGLWLGLVLGFDLGLQLQTAGIIISRSSAADSRDCIHDVSIRHYV